MKKNLPMSVDAEVHHILPERGEAAEARRPRGVDRPLAQMVPGEAESGRAVVTW